MAHGYRMDLSKTELKVKGEMEMLFNLKTCIQNQKKTLSEAFNLIERDLTGSIDDVQNIVKGVADKYLATTKTHLIKLDNIGNSELQQVEMTENGYKTFIKTLTELKKEKHDGSFVTRFMWLQDDMENLKGMPSVQSEKRLKSFDRSAILSTIANEITLRIQEKYKSFKDLEDQLNDFNGLLQSLTEENESFGVIREHWKSVEKNSKLSKIFPEPPMIAFRQPSSLRNLLVRAEVSDNRSTPGECRSCGENAANAVYRCSIRQHFTVRIWKVLQLPAEKTKKMVTSLQKKLDEEVKQKENLSEMCDKFKAAYMKQQKTNQTQAERLANMQRSQTDQSRQYREMQTMVETLKCEKEALMQRLSKVPGMKMKDNNPSIADLSDPNRPEKLSEKFREIYDNAWTTLLDDINEKTGDSDDICIKKIVSALMMMYDTCKNTITNNKREIAKLVGYPEDCFDKPYAGGTEGHDPVLKTLKDLIQVSVTHQSVAVTKNIKQFPEIKTILQVGGKNGDAFITECLQLCLYMCIHDPPVVLDFSCKSGDAFNNDKFTPFTKSGAVVDYVVWPVMYLSDNGAIMSKGIAQGK
ncbi:uncharacterized protein LOC134727687 [Mytilus trossulus]|uniref:uncharacterized protein LOC134727687 n=1 Tax=Mytilus trossulus TaxID=6551 RepID=UPI003004E242